MVQNLLRGAFILGQITIEVSVSLLSGRRALATVITHAIAASALATVAPKELSRARLVIVLGVLAMIPDLDVIGFHYGILYADALGHRGFTHSILFATIAAVVTPFIAFSKLRVLRRPWWIVVGLAFIATLSHGVIDSFSDAGLGVGFFIPFDDTRFFAPWRPLATSPLSISAFINGPAARILMNEFYWVGIPLAGLFGGLYLIRRIGGRDDG